MIISYFLNICFYDNSMFLNQVWLKWKQTFLEIILLDEDKRYSKIDQHLARHFKYNGGCLSSPPPFLSSQIIIPFSNSMISNNQETSL